LRNEIEIDSWKNIPIPIVNATKSFIKAFQNISNIIEALIKENKKKSAQIV